MSHNISKVNTEKLLDELEQIRTALTQLPESETKDRLLRYTEDINEDLSNRKYGFVFEDHREKIQEILAEKEVFLREVEALAINRGGNRNLLIEGENYAALVALQKDFKDGIDLCIIDPPYNRQKKDFIYNDNYVDPSDRFAHSKWASFMTNRLQLAKELLRPEGYIFINIDDNELTTLRMVCDEVFGEENFVGMYMWEKTSTAPALSKKIRKKLEYILCYAKKLDKKHQFSQGLLDGGDAPLLNTGNPVNTLVFPAGTVRFGIEDGEYRPFENKKAALLSPVTVKDGTNVNRLVLRGEFKWSQVNLDREISTGTYFLIKSKLFSIRYQRSGKRLHKTPQNLLNASLGVGTNEDAAKELRGLGITKFEYPKPVSLYTFLIDMANLDKDITILDFFAGSGTTGHAVMRKNSQDGGTRRFILCTDNQENACREITYERLGRAMEQEGFFESLRYLQPAFREKREEL